MRCANAQRLEGSRFSGYRETSRIRLSASSGQRMSQRAAPGSKPARRIQPRLSIRLYPDHRAANRWVVPGSRLFSPVAARLVMRRKFAGSPDTRQSGSPPGVGNVPTPSRTRTRTSTLPTYPCNNNLVGSSIQSLTRTRKVTASLPSTTRWS